MKKTLLVVWSLMLACSSLALVPGVDLYVPAVGHGLGAADANGVRPWWRSDLWVFNPSTAQPAHVTVFLLLRGQGNPNPASQALTVDPGATVYLPDLVLATFGADNTFGGLHVTSDLPVVVTGRSYDANVTVVNRPQGTAGQFFSGIPGATAIGAGDAADVIGLDQDAATTSGTWRSNLALVETTGNPVDLLLQRVDSDGTILGSIPYHLDGWMVNQINYALTGIVSAFGSNQRINVTVTGGTGRVIANASRIDNRTGDPATVEMAGAGRQGRYLAKLVRSDYEAPITLTVDGGAVTAVDATILFTDADVPGCSGQVFRLAGPLSTPVDYDATGTFNFVASDTGLGVTLQVNGTIAVTGALTGNASVTVTGAPGCNGTKAWPLIGSRIP